jgi:predicted metal-binding membrane protein
VKSGRFHSDQFIVAAGLLAMAGLSWMYLVRMAAAMNASADEAAMHAAMGMTMPGMEADYMSLWLMWTVMMVAMMVPSAAPVAWLVVGTYRRRAASAPRSDLAKAATISSFVFVSGYLLVWTAFSALAAAVQVALRAAALLSSEMAATSRIFAAIVLVAAGLYQWLPVKDACLTHCRSPLDFLTRHWREGLDGALAMGARHGAFCVGCCWALMALLFVAGVMNLLWVAAIAAFVLVEKLSRGRWPSRVGGALLVAWGCALLS